VHKRAAAARQRQNTVFARATRRGREARPGTAAIRPPTRPFNRRHAVVFRSPSRPRQAGTSTKRQVSPSFREQTPRYRDVKSSSEIAGTGTPGVGVNGAVQGRHTPPPCSQKMAPQPGTDQTDTMHSHSFKSDDAPTGRRRALPREQGSRMAPYRNVTKQVFAANRCQVEVQEIGATASYRCVVRIVKAAVGRQACVERSVQQCAAARQCQSSLQVGRKCTPIETEVGRCVIGAPM